MAKPVPRVHMGVRRCYPQEGIYTSGTCEVRYVQIIQTRCKRVYRSIRYVVQIILQICKVLYRSRANVKYVRTVHARVYELVCPSRTGCAHELQRNPTHLLPDVLIPIVLRKTFFQDPIETPSKRDRGYRETEYNTPPGGLNGGSPDMGAERVACPCCQNRGIVALLTPAAKSARAVRPGHNDRQTDRQTDKLVLFKIKSLREP